MSKIKTQSKDSKVVGDSLDNIIYETQDVVDCSDPKFLENANCIQYHKDQENKTEAAGGSLIILSIFGSLVILALVIFIICRVLSIQKLESVKKEKFDGKIDEGKLK